MLTEVQLKLFIQPNNLTVGNEVVEKKKKKR